MKKTNKSEAEILHQKAEELLKKKSLKTDSQLSETDILRLNHELQVHQIELEMQYEELKLAYEQAIEHNQAEEPLKESEERFRTLFENSTIGIYRTTPDGQILLANPTLIKLLGYSSFEELADRNLAEDGFEPSFERTHFMDIIKREGEVKGLESAWTRMDGTTVFINESARGINDKEGMIIYYDGIVEDITLRKQAEEMLRKSEQMLQMVLDNFPGVVFWKDRHSNYLGCNQSFATGAGLNSPAEIVGKTDLNLPWASTEAISYRKDDLDVMENGKERLHIVEMQHQSDGQVIWFDTSKFALRNSLGQVIGVIGVSNDISMLKMAEQELINTNKELAYQNSEKEKQAIELIKAKVKAEESDRLKSTFLANMSHEVRTPMNGIIGFTELLKEPNLTNEEQQDYIRTIELCGVRMQNTLNDIIDFSKIESGLTKVANKESNINGQIEFIYKFFKPESK
jgi:PAS domain S-box-containing protein